MNSNFGDNKKFSTWRKLWTWLAEAEMGLGLDFQQEQIDQMRANIHNIDYEMAAKGVLNSLKNQFFIFTDSP